MSVHLKTTPQTRQCVKNTSEPMTHVSAEWTRMNKCSYEPNLDQMLSPLCLPPLPRCHLTFLVTFQEERQATKSDPSTSCLWKKSINPIRGVKRAGGETYIVISGHFPNIHSHWAEQFTQRQQCGVGNMPQMMAPGSQHSCTADEMKRAWWLKHTVDLVPVFFFIEI